MSAHLNLNERHIECICNEFDPLLLAYGVSETTIEKGETALETSYFSVNYFQFA